jgi:hypothetical protein
MEAGVSDDKVLPEGPSVPIIQEEAVKKRPAEGKSYQNADFVRSPYGQSILSSLSILLCFRSVLPEEHILANSTEPSTSTSRLGMKKKGLRRVVKKAHDAPRRFKSSYIFFAEQKFKEIKEKLYREGIKAKVSLFVRVGLCGWVCVGGIE